MSKNKDFFKKQSAASKVKTDIVVNYFCAWAEIMKSRCPHLTYLDLFSGPGQYKDGAKSTPLRILDELDKKSYHHSKVRLHFYEGSKIFWRALKVAVESHDVFQKLTHKPVINLEYVDRQLVDALPVDDGTFSFIDPHGYTGVSLDLLTQVTKKWGCDSVFFLSTSGIIRNIKIASQQRALSELFGREGYEELRGNLESANSGLEKDQLILTSLENAVVERQKMYFLPFGIEFKKRRSKSHYLCFITKAMLGFRVMKGIMAKESESDSSGIPYYVFSEVDRNDRQLSLAVEDRMAKLIAKISVDFSGKSILVKKFLDECDRKRYKETEANIKEAVDRMEIARQISVSSPRDKRQMRNGKPTLGDKHTLKFQEI